MYRDFLQSLEKRFRALLKKRGVTAVLSGIVAILIAYLFLKPLFFTIAFFLLATLSLFYKKIIPLGIGFELTSFSAILCGILFGPFAAIFAGAGAIVFAGMLMRKFEGPSAAKYAFHTIAAAIIGLMASILPMEANIVLWSMGLIILYDAVFATWVIKLYPQGLGKLFIWLGTHILISYWVFATFADPTLQWISALL